MLRSENMEIVNIYLSKDTAKQTLADLGSEEIVHFVDLNEGVRPDKLPYAKEVLQLEKIQARLSYLRENIDGYDDKIRNSDYESVVEQINKFYFRCVQLKNMESDTHKKLLKLKEDHCMLDESESFSGEVSEGTHRMEFDYAVGIVEKSKKFLIKRIFYQALRRNLYVKTKDVEELKTVFIVFAHGDEAMFKIRQIFTSLGGRLLDSKKYTESKKGLLELTSIISQIQKVEENNKLAIRNEFGTVAQLYKTWRYYVNREYRIHQSLNMLNFDFDRDSLVGEGWVREEDIGRLNKISQTTQYFAFEVIKTSVLPPTYFKTNKYTESFQTLTNVYGVPRYKEVNPAIFSLFTFPFLFGCMFGDVLHGLVLIIGALYIIKNYEKINKKYDSVQTIIDGRYVLLSCGVGSVIFGLLYGDVAGMAIPFKIGIDPGWHHSKNKTTFVNNLKMKLSIIIGLAHMTLGTAIAFANSIHRKDTLNIICILVPQALAFFAFLGYLVFLIIFKWLVVEHRQSLISVIVMMYTSPFNIPEPMYEGQLYVQLFLFGLLIVSIPWMLISKPTYMMVKGLVKKDGLVDLWIDEGIHTIEFTIGLISNTSSYLRLWAVSLAHAQLTDVLFSFTVGSGGVVYRVFMAPIWVAATACLLIGLEGLSSCLHALRLNWIEFHSKFYKGDGYLYKPLSFVVDEEE